MKKHPFSVLLLVAGLLLAGMGGARAQGPVTQGDVDAQATVGTSFTYQGRLMDGGAPAEGRYDLRFILYNAASGGSQVGNTIYREDVEVADGYFGVALDYGGAAFNGQARYLEVGVRAGESSDAYTALSPRQALTAAPYALHALTAPWSGLRGVPADLADGDDDTTYRAGTGLTLVGTQFRADTAYLQRRVSANCAAGSSIRAIAADGTVTCEVDDGRVYTAGAGLNLSGNQFSVDFSGSGSASTVSRSDHNHLGQTWTGNDNPLVIRGTFGSFSNNAPLVLGNTNGDGLRIEQTGRGDGVYVHEAAGNGMYVWKAGSPSSWNNALGGNGFAVGGAENDGLWVGVAGRRGVYVFATYDDGVYVGQADDDGVYVGKAGSPSSRRSSTLKNGFEVAGAEGHGLYVGRAESCGVDVGSAGQYGVYVGSAGLYGVYVGSAGRYAGYFNGNVRVTGSLSKGGGSFQIDHPLDPENQYLRHSFVESPDMMNVYNGNVTTDEEGYATVRLPDYFEALNRDYRYQLTAIGVFAQAIVAQEVVDNQFVIQTDQPNVKVSWQVTGIRRDPWAEANRVVVEEEKPPEERGTYLHPEAYVQPETRGLAYREALERGIEPPQEAR